MPETLFRIPESAFRIPGIAVHDPGIGVHDRPESAFTMLRNTQLSGVSVHIDCKLMPHSDTIPQTTEIDDIEVRLEVGPLGIALTGTALTDADVTGVDLACSVPEGAAGLSRLQLVAMQVGEVIVQTQ